MRNIKVSVLIANYNNSKYINNCITSLKKQTHKNFEIIFFDDNSSDDSLKVIKKFTKIKIIKNKKKKKYGSFNQINAYKKAISKSTGDIIFFLDSDDFFHKDKISIVIEEFKKNKDKEVIFDLPFKIIQKKITRQNFKIKILNNYWPYFPPQSCITIRKKNLKKMMTSIDFDLYPDIWMDFRIAMYAKYILKNFYILKKNLTFYRVTDSNISSKFRFLSVEWWIRRLQAHAYVKYYFLNNKIKYKINLDYLLTSNICRIFFKD